MRANNERKSTLSVRRGRRRFIKPGRVKSGALAGGRPGRSGAELEAPPAEVETARGTYDGDSAFHLYLREIGQTRLLTPAEEIELAKRIKRGDRKARDQMIKANLRLVVKIAR